MIETLTVSNFKCFPQTSLAIRPFTLLTGVNGGGKSTIIQSILLARQASMAAGRTIQLNGPFGLTLGEAREILNPNAPESRIKIRFDGPRNGVMRRSEYCLGIPDAEQALHLEVIRRPRGAVPCITNRADGFTYLSAERLGPRDMLSVSAESPESIGVGVQGEYTAQVLAIRETRQVSRRLVVRPELRNDNAGSALPRLQAEAWVSDIVRPINISAQWTPGVLASTIRFREAGLYGEDIRPANNGFGVSYALPIIVAGLLTEVGDMLIVENPEAHLHPIGQSKLGRFLARVAGSGVQVVVETHSDHVLNGARLAVAEDRTLQYSDMVVHYFGADERTTIAVREDGRLEEWPTGFFDQIERDLGSLSRARRS
ncbi:AAA family ATPase [Mycolicibacterium nivoides]|uniref:AAA family ATPase n=1 Tax=Mycolicibacterium nivoides TaxID=2487344 RepID=A0ABW9L7N8_9MYCO